MAKSLKVGAGLEEGSTLGPLTTPQSVERAQRHVRDAVQRGAKLMTGGDRPSGLTQEFEKGYWYEPTLLVGAPPDSLVAREETFSPIASVSIFDTEEEVTRRVNDTELGLTNYVFTKVSVVLFASQSVELIILKDINRAWRALENFQSGNV